MSNLHCATTLELNLNRKDYSPTTAPERNSQWMQLPHRWTRLSDLSTHSTLKIAEPLYSHPRVRYGVVQCEQVTEVHSRYYWCSDAQATDDTMWEYKIQRQCKQLSVVLSRYMVQVWRKYRCITNRIHSQPKSKFAIKAFSLRNRIWSSFSPERLARWSVATRPPYEKCLSKFVELGGGVRCCLVTLMKAFLRLSLGKYANQGCVPSTFSKWIHHGLVGGLPAMVVVRRVCLLAFLCQLG